MKKDDHFFDLLSDEAKALLPVSCRFIKKASLKSIAPTKFVESTMYRSKDYVCSGFYKPISKCFKKL